MLAPGTKIQIGNATGILESMEVRHDSQMVAYSHDGSPTFMTYGFPTVRVTFLMDVVPELDGGKTIEASQADIEKQVVNGMQEFGKLVTRKFR